MTLAIAILLVVAGLVILAVGGELLVRGATSIAQLAGLTTAVIGLTVVAMGTSLPELVVSVLAAFEGQPDIAVGNVVGSNIFNVAVVLGLTALVIPLPVHGNAVRLEWPFMFLASFLGFLLARDGTIDRLEGAFFVVSLALFVAYTVRLARRDVAADEASQLAESVESHSVAPAMRQVAVSVSAVLGGMLLLVVGGRLLVDGAIELARLAGMTERVIGLTVVAAGTSSPELAASLIAAYRKRTDVAVANIIGSNIFNLLGILGMTAVIRDVPVSEAMLSTDFWWMLGTSLLLFPLMRTHRIINRYEGGGLVLLYALYGWVLLR